MSAGYTNIPKCARCGSLTTGGDSHVCVQLGASVPTLAGIASRIREALEVDGDGVPTALVWVRPDVAEKLVLAGLAVRVAPPGDNTVLGS